MFRTFVITMLLVAAAVGVVSPVAGQSITDNVSATADSGGGEATTTPTPEGDTVVKQLDPNATVTDWRLSNGQMEIDVQLGLESTVFVTERRPGDGAQTVRFEEFRYLTPGEQTLQIDTFENESASVLVYTRRGLETDGRAVQLQVSADSGGLLEGPITSTHLLIIGATVALSFTFFVVWESVKAILGLGQGGERIA